MWPYAAQSNLCKITQCILMTSVSAFVYFIYLSLMDRKMGALQGIVLATPLLAIAH